jgi:hypothetical protein
MRNATSALITHEQLALLVGNSTSDILIQKLSSCTNVLHISISGLSEKIICINNPTNDVVIIGNEDDIATLIQSLG